MLKATSGAAMRSEARGGMPASDGGLARLLAVILFWMLAAGCAVMAHGEVTNSQSISAFEAAAKSAAAEREAGKVDEAIADYQKALAERPDWQEGWWYSGTLEYDRDNYSAARGDFEKLVALAPELGAGWDFLGLSEFELKDFAAAQEHLAKGRALGEQDDLEVARVAHYHLALLLNRSGEFAAAEKLLLELSGTGNASHQVKDALGLSVLHVPLLPGQVQPSMDHLVEAAGEAEILVSQNKFQEAQSKYAEIEKKNSQLPYLHLARGKALEGGGDVKGASAEFAEERKVAPQAFEPDRIAQLYGVNLRGTIGGAGSVGTQGGSWNAGMMAYSQGRYAEALELLRGGIAENPTAGTGWAVMGLCEFELGDYENARVHLERGRQLGLSGSAESVQVAKYHLGVLLNQQGEFREAQDVLLGATQPAALAAEVQFALGMNMLHVASLPEELRQSERQMMKDAGNILVKLKDSKYDDAFAAFDEFLKQYPQRPFVHYAYGTAREALSQYEEAEKQFQEEVRISPRSELPLVRLASLELKQGRPERAVDFAGKASALAPQSAQAHYLLGRGYLESGETEKALLDLHAAEKISPNSPEIHFYLAKVYSKEKRVDEAQRERAEFARLNEMAERQRSQNGNQSYGAHTAESAPEPANAPGVAATPE